MTLGLWWLSFVATREEGDRCVGVAIVAASDSISAVKVAWALGCNPGGEVLTQWVDPERAGRLSFDLPIGTLLTAVEGRALVERIGSELGS